MLMRMNVTRGAALGVGLSFFIANSFSLFVSALTTTPTVVLDDAPLLISAYQRDGEGLKFVQLYNAGSTPVKLDDWNIRNESGTRLVMSGVSGGWMTPKSHVIASRPGGVTGAGIEIEPLPFGTDARLLVVPPAGSGYKQTEYELKASGATVWRRSPTQTGYSSTLSSFAAYTGQSLFDDGLYTPPQIPQIEIVEIYPYASDCAPYDVSILCGDYAKLYNPTNRALALDDYVLRTDSGSSGRTSSNTFSLDGVSIAAGGYYTVWLTDDGERAGFTNSGGYLWLEDTYGLAVYESTTTRYESAGAGEQGYAWARNDKGIWEWTSSPQPLGANIFQILSVAEPEVLGGCPAGKYRNPDTGRCRTIEEAVNALAACPEGQSRNTETNRCRTVAAAVLGTSLVPCREGQERNPATNRCRSIVSAVAELIPCDEGYERNPATNRCRKLQPLVTPASVPVSEAATEGNAALPWVLAFAGLGAVGYGVYEWRSEISGGLTRLIGRYRK